MALPGETHVPRSQVGRFRAGQRRRGAADEQVRRLDIAMQDAACVRLMQAIGDEAGGATVDGSHPTDLGMVRYADAYEKALRKLIKA